MSVLHLCAGIDGMGLGLGVEPTWVAEVDTDAAAVLARHYPAAPNLGDITTVSWAWLAGRVDVLTAGYPCQPFSLAGQRKGTDDERHLWPTVRDAVAATRPRLVLLENVRGHLSLGFDEVLGDLADIGFDAEWGVFSSAEVGAPHRRERLFVAATPTASRGEGWQGGAGRWVSGGVVAGEVGGRGVALLPTPTAADGAGGAGVAASRQGGTNLRTVARDLLPTSTASDGLGGRLGDMARAHELAGTEYWPAVQHWAEITGTESPPFVRVGPKGGRTVDARFVEWMMGFPAGWVTGLGVSNSRALKLLGNAIQPQTAAIAVAELTARLFDEAAS